MLQIEAFTIENPCRGICESNNSGFCNGCGRSREERFNWSKLPEQQKRKVLENSSIRLRKQLFLKIRAMKIKQLAENPAIAMLQENLIDTTGNISMSQTQYSIFSLPQFAPEKLTTAAKLAAVPPEQGSLF